MVSDLEYLAAAILVLGAVTLYHGVTEHHIHLHYFWRYVRPGMHIPQTRHDTRWHGMGHAARWRYYAGMAAVTFCLGTAWRWHPRLIVITLAAAVLVTVTALGARTLSRTFGERHRHPVMREEDY
jgi:hypothetical protein